MPDQTPEQMEKIVRFLKKVPLFRSLKEQQIRKMAKRMKRRDYNDGDVIVEQGQMGIGLFVLANGQVEVHRKHTDGTTTHLDTLDETDFFGELALLDEMPRTASVIAKGEVACLALSRLDFMDELHEDPDIAIAMLKEMAMRFRRIITHM